LGLSSIDNTQSQFPVAVSSLSSLSSKAPITNPSLACRSFNGNEVPLELKVNGLLSSVKEKLGVLDSALVTRSDLVFPYNQQSVEINIDGVAKKQRDVHIPADTW